MNARIAVINSHKDKLKLNLNHVVDEYISSNMYKPPKQHNIKNTKSLKASVMSDKSPEICHCIEDSENDKEPMDILNI